MKSFTSTTLTTILFASATLCAPAPTPFVFPQDPNTAQCISYPWKMPCNGPSAQIRLYNDDAHTSAVETFCLDNHARNIPEMFAGSDIDLNDRYLVTRASLVSWDSQYPKCLFQSNGGSEDYLERLTRQAPNLNSWGFSDPKRGIMDLKHGTIQCTVDTEEPGQSDYGYCLGYFRELYTECAKGIESLLEKKKTQLPPCEWDL